MHFKIKLEIGSWECVIILTIKDIVKKWLFCGKWAL